MRDRPGLARPRSGQDADRPAGREDRLALRGIEVGEQVVVSVGRVGHPAIVVGRLIAGFATPSRATPRTPPTRQRRPGPARSVDLGYAAHLVLDGRRRSAPSVPTVRSRPIPCPDRAPQPMRAGPPGASPCHSPPSGSRPTSSAPWPTRATSEPTPVQADSIPLVLAGRDLLAGAQTGTGKTAAFVLPILQHPPRHRGRASTMRRPATTARAGRGTGLPIRCLVLTPTRELALQVEQSVRTYGARRPIRSHGHLRRRRLRRRRSGRCGPGRRSSSRRPDGSSTTSGSGRSTSRTVEILVLDEADRMLDMGFIRDIRRILALLPPRRQNLLFSATFSDEIRRLAAGFLDDPPTSRSRAGTRPSSSSARSSIPSTASASASSSPADPQRPDRAGARVHAHEARREPARRAARPRRHQGRRDPRQQEPGPARPRAGTTSRRAGCAILVATEIAARGLDIDGLPHVVNFELPMVARGLHPPDRPDRPRRHGR